MISAQGLPRLLVALEVRHRVLPARLDQGGSSRRARWRASAQRKPLMISAQGLPRLLATLEVRHRVLPARLDQATRAVWGGIEQTAEGSYRAAHVGHEAAVLQTRWANRARDRWRSGGSPSPVVPPSSVRPCDSARLGSVRSARGDRAVLPRAHIGDRIDVARSARVDQRRRANLTVRALDQIY